MLDKHRIDTVSAQLFSTLPEHIRQTETALKEGFKDILTQLFSNLDMVSREEFDVQSKVLARTRQKLEALEQRMKA